MEKLSSVYSDKRHWNGVSIDGTIPDDEIYSWVDHAYDLVVKGLTKAQRTLLAEAN